MNNLATPKTPSFSPCTSRSEAMVTTNKTDWLVPMGLIALAFIPVVAGVVRLNLLVGGGGVTPDSARFTAMLTPFVLHIVSATLFCLMGAFQFVSAFRRRSPSLHRVAGRVVAPCGILAALSGLWMTAVYAIPAELQGGLLYAVRIVVALSMTWAIMVSIRAILRGRVAQHRAWMIRAYALGQGAGTQVLILLPVTLIAGAPTFFFRDVLMASAWGLNVLLAEWIIRHHKLTA